MIDKEKYRIILVGVNQEARRKLPPSIIAIERTKNKIELAEIYTASNYFINPTREEVFGLVNIEAISCGIPVITFPTGGSPESLCGYGCVTKEKTARDILRCVEQLKEKGLAREPDITVYDKEKRFMDYVELYGFMLG